MCVDRNHDIFEYVETDRPTDLVTLQAVSQKRSQST